MIQLILIEPEHPGNVGAIARAMANFDFKELVLVNPQCKHLSEEAICRAKHAGYILKKAKVKTKKYLDKLDYLIGTTAIIGTDYNIPRSPLTPEQLADKVVKKKGKIGILIGRESSGLSIDEIKRCDFMVTIPAGKKYPTMNISHAVGIILYELFKKQNKPTKIDDIEPISKKEKEVMLKKIDKILDNMKFTTPEKKETQKIVWKKIIGKSMMTKREAFALLGFLRKIQ